MIVRYYFLSNSGGDERSRAHPRWGIVDEVSDLNLIRERLPADSPLRQSLIIDCQRHPDLEDVPWLSLTCPQILRDPAPRLPRSDWIGFLGAGQRSFRPSTLSLTATISR